MGVAFTMKLWKSRLASGSLHGRGMFGEREANRAMTGTPKYLWTGSFTGTRDLPR